MSGDVDLYNLSPLAHLLIVGALVAAVPLAWVWWRVRVGAESGRRNAMPLLVTMTLFLTFDLILFGAFTRLTDSGLGCPDWPGCYGAATPFGAAVHIDAAQTAMPTGPVTTGKAWVEMIHRYLASGVGALILILTIMAWRQRTARLLATVSLIWVCVQGAFGALTVTMKLFPAIVTLHLLGAMILLALLRSTQVRLVDVAPSGTGANLRPAVFGLVVALFGLVWLQMGLGAWVSTNYAVLACQDFPTCQGQWWPAMNFSAGFEWWRPLGQDGQGTAIPFEALTAIHYTHRLMAYLVLALAIWVGMRLREVPDYRAAGYFLWFLAAWQLATGVSNVVFNWPLLAAVSHTGGAAGFVLVLTGVLVRARFLKTSSTFKAIQS